MHGLAAWIVLELAPGIFFTNSPLAPTVDWLHSFFPVEKPVELRTGDRVKAKIQTNNGEVWRWHIRNNDGNTDGEGPSAVKARFDHSTLWNFPLDPAQVKKQFPNYVPKLSRKGEAEKFLLGAFDGKRSAAGTGGRTAGTLRRLFSFEGGGSPVCEQSDRAHLVSDLREALSSLFTRPERRLDLDAKDVGRSHTVIPRPSSE